MPVLIDESKGQDGNPWDLAVHTRIWHMAEEFALVSDCCSAHGRGLRARGREGGIGQRLSARARR